MRVRITGPVAPAIVHVACNMRDRDRDEIFATRWEDDPLSLAEDTLAWPGPVWVGWLETEPVAVYGGKPMWPGVWQVFLYGTDKTLTIARHLTRHIRRVMMPALAIGGAHRAQCYSLATYTEAHDWLRLLGAREEGRLVGHGKGGEDFLVFGWGSEAFDVFRGRSKRQQPAA